MLKRGVSAWGRLAEPLHDWRGLNDLSRVAQAVQGQSGIAFGNGRSYGDQALNPEGILWATRGLDRFISFDADTGVLECECGVLLKDIIDLVLPRGWFVPVTPGTQYVTVGGAIANDVHGKNHHRYGNFGEHVLSLTLLRTDGTRIECGPQLNEPWFRATLGGMGLTGVMTTARLQMRRVPGPWVRSEAQLFNSLQGFVELSEASADEWEYTVAWIDCLATRGDVLKGVFFRGNHAQDSRPMPAVRLRRLPRLPFTPPMSLVNSVSLRAFNQMYYLRQKWSAGKPVVQSYAPFFYPLDGLLEWNRMYGPKGFYQYQCVVPRQAQYEAMKALLNLIAGDGSGSFLGVLKTFGQNKSPGLMSFPMPGITLALDFPNHGSSTLRLFERMDAVVMAAGGRIYPAKDACMPRSLFERGYPALQEFRHFRDPGLSSQMSRRLLGD